MRYFNRLLGMPSDFPQLKNETRWISSKVDINKDGKIVHSVGYQGINYFIIILGKPAEFLPE